MYRNSIALLILAAFAPAIAGQTTCAPCHREAKTQAASGMAKALERGEDSGILKEHRRLIFTDHQFTYKIERDGNRSLYSVSNGADTLTVPIPWAFGLGEPGQTYVLEHNGKWYESRVSFYNVLDGLDFTLGARSLAPQNLTEALGRELPVQEVAACFDCHSTNSVHGTEVDFQHLNPGVSCEACHGPAADHVASFKSGKGTPMPKLSRLSTEEMFDLCGRCHRTWDAIAAHGPKGVANVRFQPYRLTNSKCYDAADQRISCVACHDPHSSAQQPASFYESKCVACHTPNSNAKVCKISKQGCIGCHMPKVEIPDTHHKFTDHEIRVVRAGSPYPH